MTDLPDTQPNSEGEHAEDPTPAKPSAWGSLFYVLLFLAGQAVAGGIMGFLKTIKADLEKPGPLDDFALTPLELQTFALAGMLANVIIIVWLYQREPHRGYLTAIFKPVKSFSTLVGWTVFGTIATYVTFALQAFLLSTFGVVEVLEDTNPLRNLGPDGGSTLLYCLMILNVAILAPLVEEIFFRGLILQRLLEAGMNGAAIVISGLIFAAIHFDPKIFIPIFVLGAIAAASVIVTRSILPAIGMHFLNNFTAISFTIIQGLSMQSAP